MLDKKSTWEEGGLTRRQVGPIYEALSSKLGENLAILYAIRTCACGRALVDSQASACLCNEPKRGFNYVFQYWDVLNFT